MTHCVLTPPQCENLRTSSASRARCSRLDPCRLRQAALTRPHSSSSSPGWGSEERQRAGSATDRLGWHQTGGRNHLAEEKPGPGLRLAAGQQREQGSPRSSKGLGRAGAFQASPARGPRDRHRGILQTICKDGSLSLGPASAPARRHFCLCRKLITHYPRGSVELNSEGSETQCGGEPAPPTSRNARKMAHAQEGRSETTPQIRNTGPMTTGTSLCP